jgi:4'-phosphopantetheinyl transferase
MRERPPPLLERNSVHVWYAPLVEVNRAVSEGDCASSSPLCSAAERSRFLVCRSLLRTLLGRYTGIEPGRIALWRTDQRSKPFLSATHAAGRGLQFSVSHSGAHALLAFAIDRPVGVDLEVLRPLPEAHRLVARFFSPREAEQLLLRFAMEEEEEERSLAFFRYWTRKEACLKAGGRGLSLAALKELEFLQQRRRQRRVVSGFDLVPAPESEARRWAVHELRPAENLIAALAVQAGRAACAISLFRAP